MAAGAMPPEVPEISDAPFKGAEEVVRKGRARMFEQTSRQHWQALALAKVMQCIRLIPEMDTGQALKKLAIDLPADDFT